MPLASIDEQPSRQSVLFSEKELRSLIAYVASLAPGPAIPRPRPAHDRLAEGLHLFTDHCAGCHQLVGRGGFVTGARVPPLQSATATQIAEAVRLGPYLMPSFPATQISDDQLNAIIAYVLSTRHPDNRGGWGVGNLGPIPEGLVTWWIAVPLLIIACMLVGRRLRR
jgi:ubiquinol-cytochrome c reductase cytochrome c subunit